MTESTKRPSVKDTAIIEEVAREIAAQVKGADDDNLDQAAKDIADAISTYPYGDGYELAKLLESRYGWFRVNFNVAEIMDSAGSILFGKVREATETWVKRNAIRPKSKLGDMVDISVRGQAYNGEIVYIDEKQAEYTVMVPQCGHVREGTGTRGFVIHFEAIHDLVAPPEEYSLEAQ